MHRFVRLTAVIAVSGMLVACGDDTAEDTAAISSTTSVATAPVTTGPTATTPVTTSPPSTTTASVDTTTPTTAPMVDPSTTQVPTDTTGALTSSRYLGDYTLTDSQFGTEVTVTVANGLRTIVANALPNHETGTFPNRDNPNTITAQDARWSFPATPVMTGEARWAYVPGVSVNGVKFEPATAETISCSTGESYAIEAVQNTYELGLDLNNAHVQPNGEYHYHGVSELMIEAFNGTADDLVLVGFGADGHLMYYSKSGAHPSSYRLDANPRTGTNCQPSLRGQAALDLEGTLPDGAYTSDWVFDPSAGSLDACNGTTIDGTYVYFITESYPFLPRCLMGEFTQQRPGGAPAGTRPG